MRTDRIDAIDVHRHDGARLDPGSVIGDRVARTDGVEVTLHATTASIGDQLRTYLAAERTLLAWIRTGLAMMGFGFLVERFGLFLREIAAMRNLPVPPSHRVSLWIGTSLVLMGVAVNVLAANHHLRFTRQSAGHEADVRHGSRLGVIVAWVLAALGFAMAIYLIFLE